ncbi:MAG: sulfatase family protein [Armatimonadota bacterium]
MMTRPNLLYILTDQQSHLAMSNAGNCDLLTPAMDRLAASGVVFERAYCPFPLCTPARAAMFSGLMPHQCGVTRNGQGIAEPLREQELGRWLQAGGYDCFYGGKWHVSQIAMPWDNDHGFKSICGFGDNRLTDACVDFLQGPATARPFFLVASFDNPHNICEWARGQDLPWGPIPQPPPVTECPNLPANFTPAPFEPEIVRLEQRANHAIYAYQDRAPEDWRRLRWAYYRLVEKVDQQIGRLLDALKQTGLIDNTLVVFTSDHGDAHGSHRWNQKSALFEEIVRVPLLLSGPGVPAGRRDCEHLVSNALDLFPTLCDFAQLQPPPNLPGRSLRPLLDGKTDQWREVLPLETRFDGGRGYDAEGRALLVGWHKYVIYDRGQYREQLFDLQADPGEQVNLAVESRYQPLLEAMRRQLAAYCQSTADPFRCPGWQAG